ncbi:hypothetical protein [Runella sp.]|jgi:hypothetical protein
MLIDLGLVGGIKLEELLNTILCFCHSVEIYLIFGEAAAQDSVYSF